MDLWKKLKGELIDIVQWLDDSPDTLVYRFERLNNEIKNGAKLVVRESQTAVFVDEGRIADVFTPGTYTLSTANLPILATLKGWKYGFESPFKCEVYFVNTRQFTDMKWGTMNPVMLRDAEFGPVRLRAFGTYAFKCVDPAALVREVSGTSGRFTIEGITEQLRNTIVSRFTDVLGESKIPALDLAANYDELGKFLGERIKPSLTPLGLDLTALLVENISLPPEVEAALDKRTSMGIVGDLNRYTQFQAANAMEAAAKTPNSAAAQGMGLGAGFAMAQQMGSAMGQPVAGAGAPPPIPAAAVFFVAIDGKQAGPFDLATLKAQASAGRLSRESLVWKNGMAEWTAAGNVSELSGIFTDVPPPLPPR
ncbi:MAG: SPFH domain-containing protein [Planctomycetota bacterium]|nr:SPFH domain-containing protein [Planctomycetota bacterium]